MTVIKRLTYGNPRRVTNTLIANHCSELKKNGAHVIGQSTSSLCKQHSWYSSSSRRHTSFTLYNAKSNLCNFFSQSFFGHARRNIIKHPVHIAQKGYWQIRFYSGPALFPLTRSTYVQSFFSILPRCYTTANPLQKAWRRFLQARYYSRLSVSPFNRDVYMPSFFSILSRHNTVIPHAQVFWKRSVHLHSYCGFAFSRHKNVKHYSRFPWRRFTQRRSYSGAAVPPSNRGIRAVILALKGSHPVFYSIFASIIGAVAWPQRASADAEDYFPIGNSLYMHAQDGHMYLVSLILSVLEGLVLILRTMYLAVLFSPCIAIAPFADSFSIEFRTKWLHLVRVTLEKAGPAFIKWGQWAATRPDLFPRDLCIELSKLHSKAPEHSFAYTKRSIEKAFGRKLLDIFDSFEERPIASGSVAQVHRATLRFRYPGKKDNPIEVAVKVRHPGVSESIRRDFVIIHFFAKISNFIPALKWLRLDESVQQFAVFMMSQVDLSREAAQLSRFNYNFSKSRYVSFPRPLYPLVHPAVLVETYEKGESVSRYVDDDDELIGSDRTKRFLADVGTRALLKMLLEDNFIHADMHPGNILVRETQGSTKPHVVFLDVGMTAELSRNDQLNLREFFKAVAVRDGRTAAECTLKFSKNQSCPNPEAFIEEVEKSFTFWGTKEGDIVHPAECMHQLLEQVRRHKVNIDGNVCTVMVTTLVLEGWQRKLDPDYNVMHTLQTLLFKADWVEDLVYTINGLV